MALSAGTRRTVACLLVGLGALLIVAALMIPTYTISKMAKTPLDLEITTVATNKEGEDSLVLDSKSLTSPEGSAKVDTDVPLVFQRFVTVEEPSDAEKMTIQAGTTLRRIDKQGDTGLLTAEIDRVTIDRKTGMPVDESPNGSISMTVNRKGESVAEPLHREGLQYRFPIGTEKKDYPYFDRTARATYPIEFVEETEIQGTPVYHFRQEVPVTNLWEVVQAPTHRLTLPAAKWGVEGGDEDVTMTRWYTNVRDVWVEPQTGTVVDGGEQIHLYYARNGEKPEVTALKANLVFDENTIESQLAIAKDNIDTLSLFGRTVPIILGIVGVLALIAGIALGIRGSGTPAPAGRGSTPSTRPGGSARTQTGPRRGDANADAPTETIKLPKQP
ncbi:DUF3068 domain-containing protein [Nocardia donostiensis]|uniref:DUF3068 domain-containing protein n=1 Tax=Nocardia donostiensis TaxID=1538463 RepID=A0A1W0AQL2_9NOCA|nr:DUF3068 domain-containing protein [Nocardia donostiensis]ONM45956.1 hypothetical protein B0T46_25590 [Nocardia donostiensis]OQS12533.1 hypothetical protein B0T36_24680 [Nocardia donostiensis]OQS19017.1 hypothetical protein B0T44_16145 [Nocardia donostiensis]